MGSFRWRFNTSLLKRLCNSSKADFVQVLTDTFLNFWYVVEEKLSLLGTCLHSSFLLRFCLVPADSSAVLRFPPELGFKKHNPLGFFYLSIGCFYSADMDVSHGPNHKHRQLYKNNFQTEVCSIKQGCVCNNGFVNRTRTIFWLSSSLSLIEIKMLQKKLLFTSMPFQQHSVLVLEAMHSQRCITILCSNRR